MRPAPWHRPLCACFGFGIYIHWLFSVISTVSIFIHVTPSRLLAVLHMSEPPCVSMALYFSKVAQSITLVPFLYVCTKAGSRQRAETWHEVWDEERASLQTCYWVQREAIKLLKSWRLPLIITPGCKMRTEGGEVLGGKEVEQSPFPPTNRGAQHSFFLPVWEISTTYFES